MRFSLLEDEVFKIIDLLQANDRNDPLITKLQKQIDKERAVAIRKKHNTKKATQIRSERAKQKIQNAINLLRLEGEKITISNVAKKSETSYVTVKRFFQNLKNSKGLL